MAGPRLLDKLLKIRTSVSSKRVIWLLPYARAQAYTVSSIAATFGDETLDLLRFRSEDKVHPLSYSDVAIRLLR